MTSALAPFFGMGVPSAGPDAYPGTPPWAVAVIWGVTLLLILSFVWRACREVLHERESESEPEPYFENAS